MTPTSIRTPQPAGPAGTCIDHDLRVLADQLQRCHGSQGRWFRWYGLLGRVRAFAVAHVATAATAVVAAGGLWWLLH